LIRTDRSHPPTQNENGKKCDFTHTFLSLFQKQNLISITVRDSGKLYKIDTG